MTSSTEPRPRGRPKKVVEAQKEINPDCQPATRGYVKCLLRKTRNHTHRNHVDGRVIGWSAIVGWSATVAILMMNGAKYNDGTPFVFPEAWFVGIVVFTAICTLMSWDLYNTSELATDRIREEEPEAIQKYTPPTPVCEKRKGCE